MWPIVKPVRAATVSNASAIVTAAMDFETWYHLSVATFSSSSDRDLKHAPAVLLPTIVIQRGGGAIPR